MRVSVVICAHTLVRWDELRASVASVLDQTHPAHEVIVSIDHNDELLERARTGLHGARVVATEGERGVSEARNTGVRHATGEVVAFLDDDARADRHWLEAIARAHESARVLGTGGLIEPRWEGERPDWLPPELYWVIGCSYRGLPTTAAPVRNPIGANMSFVRDVFADAGGFSAELGRVRGLAMSCEDTEFAARARRARPGTIVLNLPDARVEHAVPPARTTWRYLAWRCWTEGRAKVLVADDVGLTPERAYVTRVLPAAVAAGLRDSLRGDPSGIGRAAAIVVALALTGAGYIYGMAAGRPAGG
jgi:glycosyltransferase involved in cell wall biosynthesis